MDVFCNVNLESMINDITRPAFPHLMIPLVMRQAIGNCKPISMHLEVSAII
jgi:hypothetical protein